MFLGSPGGCDEHNASSVLNGSSQKLANSEEKLKNVKDKKTF